MYKTKLRKRNTFKRFNLEICIDYNSDFMHIDNPKQE